MTTAALAKAAAGLAGALLTAAIIGAFAFLWNGVRQAERDIWQLDRNADAALTATIKEVVAHGVRIERVERDVDRLERAR